ncbi:MAG: isopentenyl-diphosphate Delta-isomerase [Acidimicrobiales bacterium]
MTDDPDQVVLLNEDGSERSNAGKLDAHRPPGQLHRAFSVFLFDAEGRVLLQRRADGKHLFAGLWSNSCCSHPRPGEAVVDAARRRVREELGLDCALEEVGLFEYHAHDPVSGMDERERVHVVAGLAGAAPNPDPSEVSDVQAVPFAEVFDRLARQPSHFSPWLAGTATEVRPWWQRTFGDNRLPSPASRRS